MQEQGGRTGQAWHSALAFLQVVNTCALGLYLLLLLLLRSIISIQCQFSPENAPSDCAFSITDVWAVQSYQGNAAEQKILIRFLQTNIWRTEFNQTDSFITESRHKNVWLLKFNWFHKTLVEILRPWWASNKVQTTEFFAVKCSFTGACLIWSPWQRCQL